MTARINAPAIRVLLIALGLVTLAWSLGVVVFGVVDLVTQLGAHTIRPTMYWATDNYRFTDEGDGHSGVKISGVGGGVVTAVTGVSSGTITIYTAATVVRLVVELVLGGLAVLLIQRLRDGRPFVGAAWRLVAATSGAVLALGVVSQLLAWWSRLAIISDAGGEAFSKSFVFDPLTVTVGLALALVAVAFRVGEHLQNETEGLV